VPEVRQLHAAAVHHQSVEVLHVQHGREEVTSSGTIEPWLKDPDERWHTKIKTIDLGDGTSVDQEVSCNCDLFDEGETHYDFDGM
jgi:hypothetical protein